MRVSSLGFTLDFTQRALATFLILPSLLLPPHSLTFLISLGYIKLEGEHKVGVVKYRGQDYEHCTTSKQFFLGGGFALGLVGLTACGSGAPIESDPGGETNSNETLTVPA